MFDPAILRLVAITGTSSDNLLPQVLGAVRGGATSIQIRLKHTTTRELVAITRRIVNAVDVPVLVNDRFDVALAARAAGVHVGADDIPVESVRRCTPPGFIIGTSVGCDEEIPNARAADYVGIGPLFPTPSKADAGEAIGVDEFRRLHRAVGKPAVAIGGITVERMAAVRDSGANGAAVIGAIFSATNTTSSATETATRALLAAFDAVELP